MHPQNYSYYIFAVLLKYSLFSSLEQRKKKIKSECVCQNYYMNVTKYEGVFIKPGPSQKADLAFGLGHYKGPLLLYEICF